MIIKVPAVGESITEVTLLRWVKEAGAYVRRDEVIAELESEKATFEVNAEVAGVLRHKAQVGDTLLVAQALAEIVPAQASESSVIAAPVSPMSASELFSVKVPAVGESITEVTLLRWMKEGGAYVRRDEVIAELESEKATFEVNAEVAGVLRRKAQAGDTLLVAQVFAEIAQGQAQESALASEKNTISETLTDKGPLSAASASSWGDKAKVSPLAEKLMQTEKVASAEVQSASPSERIRKEDVLRTLREKAAGLKAASDRSVPAREVRTEKMSGLRKAISRRLVEAKNTTAMLTTFNEADMSAIMAIRKQYKEAFKKTYDVNLGFMSFFTKACTIALMEWPAVNAYIDGDQLLYHNYCDISVAVSSPRGLVVPVIRNAEALSMAEIERAVLQLAAKAREGKLTIEEMTGGTFTITNGGVFGSLMSTPILNLPQSAILGMHKIQERPIAVAGKVEIRPMMYLALSYDHRIIDGRESVGFLVRVKELLENPEQLFTMKPPIAHLLGL